MSTTEVALGVLVFVFILRAKEWKTYWPLIIMTLWGAPSSFFLVYARHLGPARFDPVLAYRIYFYCFWIPFALSAICSLLLSRQIFNAAMRPLTGLQSLGRIVFAWVGFVSVAISTSVAFQPNTTGINSITLTVSQLERLSAIIIISLMAFVVVAIKPLGLTVRSRVFGVSGGTLIFAMANMVQATALGNGASPVRTSAVVVSFANCFAQLIWIYYFAVPEPERNFVQLPTTSPFHYWNDIARRLDQEPGVVAIGGFNPNAFAGAEVEVFRRASAKMHEGTDDDTGLQRKP